MLRKISNQARPRNVSIELPLERWPALQQLERYQEYVANQAGEDPNFGNDIELAMATWTGVNPANNKIGSRQEAIRRNARSGGNVHAFG